ncbi:recombinase family protein [Aquibacillus saliphilus]|uniref:recombinase family protein n=1 Tax=Aquibacillus saliphilus TaxID=1909422 RepID=UPI001CEFEF32|nr:recombinase family protein [Aquibacillus saliphilus]
MKVAIYARKSTSKLGQKETIENQIKICRREAELLGLEVVAIKTDSATGTDDLNRPEVKDLIEDAIKGKYDCVILKGISRLYRDTEKGLGLIKKLDRSDIRVITVEEHFDSGLSENRTGTGQLDLSRITMYLMFSEMESKKLADRIKYTQIEKAHAGEWNQASMTPYGFMYNSDTKKLKVNQPKAEVIKLIFKMYINGRGMNSIAQYLNGDNDEGLFFPSPRSKRWSEYTIGFILKNQVYCGDVVYNRRSKKTRPYKNPEMIGKTDEDIYVGKDLNEKDKWIITENAHESIIDRDTFSQAQQIMEMKAQRKGIKNNISLLAGLGKCGKCGKGLTFKRGNKNSLGQINTKDNYYCMNYIRYGKQFCTSHHIGSKELEEVVIDELLLKIKEKINYEKSVSSIPTNKKSNLDKDISKLQTNIDTLVHKMDMLLEKNMDEKITDTQFNMFNEKYSNELDVLTKQLEKLKIKQSESSDGEDKQIRLRGKYEEALNIKEYPKEKKRYIILDLVSKLVINDGEVEIEFNI